MKELLLSVPIVAAISYVLGACRADTLAAISREAGLSFLRIVGGIALVCLLITGLLALIPVLF